MNKRPSDSNWFSSALENPVLCFVMRVILLTLIAAHAFADPVVLTKTEAFELHDALTKLSPGLTPENTLFAADAINALSADANAWRTGYAKLMILQNAANAPGAAPELATAFREADSKFAAVADATKTYDLTIFAITKEEIKASIDPKTGLAAINANSIATIKRLLKKTEPHIAVDPALTSGKK